MRPPLYQIRTGSIPWIHNTIPDRPEAKDFTVALDCSVAIWDRDCDVIEDVIMDCLEPVFAVTEGRRTAEMGLVGDFKNTRAGGN